MIAWLRGRLMLKQPTRLVVDVQGVGYDVQVPVSTSLDVGDHGSQVELHIHTHVREDQLALFGFRSTFELEVFERLIAVSGVGPKLALSVLSGIEAHDFVRTIQSADLGRLTSIPGVGRKTAERLTLELRDRLPQAAPASSSSAPSTPESAVRADLVSALVNLGYQRASVEKVVDRVVAGHPAPIFEKVLRASLRELTS
jgi:Holliday junction DNA helicase RuvA